MIVTVPAMKAFAEFGQFPPSSRYLIPAQWQLNSTRKATPWSVSSASLHSVRRGCRRVYWLEWITCISFQLSPFQFHSAPRHVLPTQCSTCHIKQRNGKAVPTNVCTEVTSRDCSTSHASANNHAKSCSREYAQIRLHCGWCSVSAPPQKKERERERNLLRWTHRPAVFWVPILRIPLMRSTTPAAWLS